jgi:hypothetical protein
VVLKKPRYSLSRRLSGPHCWSGRFGEVVNPLVPAMKGSNIETHRCRKQKRSRMEEGKYTREYCKKNHYEP